ncbi:glycosyltransferase family 2 protein [Azospirillum doebereinerae]
MTRLVNVDQSLPEQAVLGRGTAFPFSGWAWDARARALRIVLRIGSRVFPAATLRDLRLDVFSTARPPGDDGQVIVSGFWGLAALEEGFPAGRHEVALEVTWDDGATSMKPLGSLSIVAPAPVPALPPGIVPDDAGDGPLIAVCMATYNPGREAFAGQIESIRNQSHANWICIIQDDGSSPEARAAIGAVIGDDPRFLIEDNVRNLGPYRNFERALERVPPQAAYVALSDQDDVWYPSKLQRLLDRLERDDALLAYSDQRIVMADGKVMFETYWTTRDNQYGDLADLLLANTVTGAASLFRRALLDVALPFPVRVGKSFHDHWLACCALAAGRIAYVAEPLYDYVQHGANVVGHCPFPPGDALKLVAKTFGLLPAAVVSVFVRRLRPRVCSVLVNTTTTYYTEYRRLALFAWILRMRIPDLPAGKRRATELFKPAAENHWSLLRHGLFTPARQRRTNHAELRLWSGLMIERGTGWLARTVLALGVRRLAPAIATALDGRRAVAAPPDIVAGNPGVPEHPLLCRRPPRQ